MQGPRNLGDDQCQIPLKVLCPQRYYSQVLTHELTLKLPLNVARIHLVFQTVGGQRLGLMEWQRFPGEATSMRIKECQVTYSKCKLTPRLEWPALRWTIKSQQSCTSHQQDSSCLGARLSLGAVTTPATNEQAVPWSSPSKRLVSSSHLPSCVSTSMRHRPGQCHL